LTKKPIAVKSPPPASARLDVEVVAELARVVGKFDLSEIEVEHQGLRVRVVRERHPVDVTHVMAAPVGAPPAAPALQALPPAAPVEPSPADHPGAVKSPMVGTAYLRPSPEAKPFVEIGSVVKAGDKILLVEAMKTFNDIEAPRAGKVTQILIESGSPVEYDQVLMIIE
jgi:acetyl-CoA carboxylase biotin carboxyl carrier protein